MGNDGGGNGSKFGVQEALAVLGLFGVFGSTSYAFGYFSYFDPALLRFLSLEDYVNVAAQNVFTSFAFLAFFVAATLEVTIVVALYRLARSSRDSLDTTSKGDIENFFAALFAALKIIVFAAVAFVAIAAMALLAVLAIAWGLGFFFLAGLTPSWELVRISAILGGFIFAVSFVAFGLATWLSPPGRGGWRYVFAFAAAALFISGIGGRWRAEVESITPPNQVVHLAYETGATSGNELRDLRVLAVNSNYVIAVDAGRRMYVINRTDVRQIRSQ